MPLIPLLPFTVAFVVGVLLQGCGVGALFMTVPLAGAIVLFLRKNAYGVILVLATALGYLVGCAHSPAPFPSGLSGRELSYSGIVHETKDYDSGRSLVLKIDSCRDLRCEAFFVKAFVPSSIPVISETDRVRFSSALSPFVRKADLPDEIDYDGPLRRMGVVASCLIKPDSIRVISSEPGLLNSIRRMRERITLVIASSSLSPQSKEFLNATLTGDRSMLSADMRELFSNTGLSHILALSGLHVGILSWLISLMLFPLWACGMKRTRVAVIIFLLWMFAVLTGLSPSVVRSVVMATVFLVALLSERVRSPLNSLCFAAIIILTFSPAAIFTVGFQLSFLAVASILIFAEKINPVGYRHKMVRNLLAYPAATLAAMLATGVVSAFYFNIFPLYFIPANFVASLLLPPVLVCGAVYVMVASAGFCPVYLGRFIDMLVDALVVTADTISRFPGAVVTNVHVPPLSVAVWMIALVALASFLYRKRIAYAVAAILLAAFAVLYPFIVPLPNRGCEAYIVKSDRHTSMLIRECDRFHIMSTAPSHELAWIIDGYNDKYRKYMLKRGVDSISTLSDPYVSPYIKRRDNRIVIGDRSFAFIYADTDVRAPLVSRTDYAVVCAGFRGDIIELAGRMKADTIILSSDLNKRRHDRYERELRAARIPVISLRDRSFSIH